MAVDFNGLFHRPKVDVDFSPIERGGAAMGNAYANIGQSIGHGLIQRAKLKEEKRQYDLDLAYKKTLQRANDLKQAELERHRQAVEKRTAEHQATMEAQGQARIGHEEDRIDQARASLRYQQVHDIRQRQQRDAERAAKEQKDEMVREHAGLAIDRGEGVAFPKEKAAMYRLRLQSDPDGVFRDVTKDVGDYVNEQHDVGLIDRSTKTITKLAEEHEKGRQERIKVGLPGGDPVPDEVWMELAALEMTPLRGQQLKAKIDQITKMASGVPAKKKDAEDDSIGLPSGGKKKDDVGFKSGGTVDELIQDRKKLAWFQSAAQESAEKDRRYPSEAMLLQAAAQGQADAVERQRMEIRHEHAEQLLAQHGWTRDQAAAPGSSMPNGASKTMSDTTTTSGPATRESLKARAIAEHWTKEQYAEALNRAGIR